MVAGLEAAGGVPAGDGYDGLEWAGRGEGRVAQQQGREGEVSGAFFACCDHRTGDLIVKLPRQRVEQLIEAGTGKPFAPAGRTFREWVLIDDRDQARWTGLIGEARLFVAGQH